MTNELLRMLKKERVKSTEEETRDAYRDVFGSPQGQTVLAHMLGEMGYFSEIISKPEETALFNYARHVLKIMGILQPSNIPLLVDAMMRLPYAEKQKKEQA